MDSSTSGQLQNATSSLPNTPVSSTMNFKVLTPEVLGHEIVTLYVGPKRKQYTVHKKLLCDGSPFFDKAFRGSFAEAREGVMYLPDDEIGAVSSFIDFLYRGSILNASDTTEIALSKATERLISLYLLAEKICMPELMDRVMDELFATCCKRNTKFGQSTIRKIYQNTHEKSMLRVFCTAVFACYVVKKNIIDNAWCDKYAQISETCPDFFVDMFRFLAEHFKTLAASSHKKLFDMIASIAGSCGFHTHEKDEDCYLQKSQK